MFNRVFPLRVTLRTLRLFFLVLTVSVVAIGSLLAYMEKRGCIHPNFASLHLCDLALDQMNEKDEGDARAQRMKTPFFRRPFKKPQNPSKSVFFLPKYIIAIVQPINRPE